MALKRHLWFQGQNAGEMIIENACFVLVAIHSVWTFAAPAKYNLTNFRIYVKAAYNFSQYSSIVLKVAHWYKFLFIVFFKRLGSRCMKKNHNTVVYIRVRQDFIYNRPNWYSETKGLFRLDTSESIWRRKTWRSGFRTHVNQSEHHTGRAVL